MTKPASICIKLMLASQLSVQNFYTEIHENLTNGLVTDTRSQTDRQTDI
jgi:hypothetical protein